MNYQVRIYNFFEHSNTFEQLFLESFSELNKQLTEMGLAPTLQKEKVLFESLIVPAMKNGLLVILFEDRKQIGYEFATLSPYDYGIVNYSFTYILPQYRGKKLSYLLRAKMLELLKKKGIKQILFSVLNSNEESKAQLETYRQSFDIKEVYRTYSVNL